jgi:predicted CoA-binding protein
MPSDYETFFLFDRYAVVGHGARHPFPKLSYAGLKQRGKTVYAVDPSVSDIAGDPAYPDLESLPGPVDAVILEVPKQETLTWVERAIARGIRDVWIHQGTDTAEAKAAAEKAGVRLRTGTCAVMYVTGGLHVVHKLINKLFGKY